MLNLYKQHTAVKKRKRNQNKNDRNEERWHFFHRRNVSEVSVEVSVEVIIRIGSGLWDTLYLSWELTTKGRGRKFEAFDCFACHRCKIFLFVIVSLAPGNWKRIQKLRSPFWRNRLPSHNGRWQNVLKGITVLCKLIGGVSMTRWTQKKTPDNNVDVTTSIRTWLW